ncbi:MAG TPA: helix-turn-helix domain-containing protein [Gemmatimonadaceae bacterium]
MDTRSRILAAARELAVEKGFGEFAMENVAQRAGVSRMTIYYQFGSKQELLDALLDRLAERGGIDRLPEAMEREDPLEALAGLIAVFCGFWESDRVAIRRLRAWGGLKPGDAESGVLERDAWRRRAVESVVRRIMKRYGRPAKKHAAGIIDVLQALTSFESYDTLAREGRDEHEVAALLDRTARAILGVKAN